MNQHQHTRLNCTACGAPKSMSAQHVSKMSPVVQVIGWIIVIPSLLGVLGSLGFFLFGVIASTQTGDAAVGAVGAFTFGGVAACSGISSLVSGLIGYLLIMKKKVWKCEHCGYHIDRD